MLKAEGSDDTRTGGYTEEELAGLSDAEREALQSQDDDLDALREVAGGDDDDDDDPGTGEDAAAKAAREKAEADAAAAAKAKEDAAAKAADDEARKKREAELAAMSAEDRKKAEEADRKAAEDAARAKAEADAKAKEEDERRRAAAAEDDGEEPLVTTYHVEPPENYEARVKELEEAKAQATQRYRDNEIDVDEMLRLHAESDKERRELDNQKLKSEMAAEMAEQQGAQRWQWEVNRFMKNVAKHEGIDYKASNILNAALDAEVKRLANDDANKDKTGDWFLETAHENLKKALGLKTTKPAGDGKGDDAATREAEAKAAAAAAERRKQADRNREQLHQGVRGLPAASGEDLAGDGEFAHLEGLGGMELETAVARMTPDQQDRWARTNG